MPFVDRNRVLTYRPLIGGIGVVSQGVNEFGTLGLIVWEQQQAWLLSNYHVLARKDFTALADGERIDQPFEVPGEAPVARLVQGRASTDLDAAIARVEGGVGVEAQILGLGAYASAPVAAQVGMRVVKSGIATGVTEGVVSSVTGSEVEIVAAPTFPAKYDLATIGDSGSVWLEQASLAPVALHSRVIETPTEVAKGYAMGDVLGRLGVTLRPT